jgi:hypothetical protein
MTGRRVDARRKSIADMFIRWGLGFQIVFLVFLDWGTVAYMQRAGRIALWHVVGLAVVNLLLVGGTMLLWSWMRGCQRAEGSMLPAARAIGAAASDRR